MIDTDIEIDTASLDSFLSEELGGEVVGTEVLSDKLNLIVAISTAEAEDPYILHRPRKLRHTSLFNTLEQEYRLLERLQETAIPTQTPVTFCEDESIMGGHFYVSTYLEGETIPLGTDLPEQFQNENARAEVADSLIETLAGMHSLAVDPFEDVCERQPPREQLARTVERLDEATRVTGHDVPRLWTVAEWLQQNVPSDPEMALVHGDFRPGNVLFAGTDHPEITGVLDWETAMLGDPLFEVGYLLLRWRDGGDPTPSLDEIEARHENEAVMEQLRSINKDGLGPFTAKPGSPTRRELVARYEDETGLSYENDRFYRAFAAVGLATVWEDLHRHAIEAGTESEKEPYVEYMAMIADSIVNGDFRL